MNQESQNDQADLSCPSISCFTGLVTSTRCTFVFGMIVGRQLDIDKTPATDSTELAASQSEVMTV